MNIIYEHLIKQFLKNNKEYRSTIFLRMWKSPVLLYHELEKNETSGLFLFDFSVLVVCFLSILFYSKTSTSEQGNAVQKLLKLSFIFKKLKYGQIVFQT